MKLKNPILSFLAIAVLLGLSLFCNPFSISAKATTGTISTNNQWTSSSISKSDQANYHYFTISNPGYVTVEHQAFSLEYSDFALMNSDLTFTYTEGSVGGASSANPKVFKASNWLEKGTYAVKINPYWDATGDYRIRVNYKAANNNETEPNNEFTKAMSLSSNKQVSGLISRDDEVDIYKFNLSSKASVLITVTSYSLEYTTLTVYNKDIEQIHEVDAGGATESDPKTINYEVTLDPGTYYVRVTPYWDATGTYKVKYQPVIKVKSLKISGNKVVTPGKSFVLKATASPKSAVDKSVAWSSSNASVATVESETGKVITNRVGKAKITASALDGGNAKKSVMVIVKPAKVDKPTIAYDSNRKKQLYVAWNYQDGVTRYEVQYSTNKSFTSSKTKTVTTRNTSIYLKKLKPKTTYYVRVRGYYKNGSKKYYGSYSKIVKRRVKK